MRCPDAPTDATAWTLRAAYIGYVRALADYGAAFHLTHEAPSVRQSLEAEQNACARLKTGCIRPFLTDALLSESHLERFTIRAKKLAANEIQRLTRLPPGDPAKAIADLDVKPKLKYRAREAWLRVTREAESAGDHPPPPSDEDLVLPA